MIVSRDWLEIVPEAAPAGGPNPEWRRGMEDEVSRVVDVAVTGDLDLPPRGAAPGAQAGACSRPPDLQVGGIPVVPGREVLQEAVSLPLSQVRDRFPAATDAPTKSTAETTAA